MIGIFDSGVGGFSAYRTVRRMLPRENILYLADRKNAPYGTKTKDELIELVNNDIEILSERGCEQILIACCTASTVFDALPPRARCLATPIIEPTAYAAAKITTRGNIAVLATERTVSSGEFTRQIHKYSKMSRVVEIEAQPLVSLVEGGARDGGLSPKERLMLAGILKPLIGQDIDTVILGCTHFSHIEREICTILGGARAVLASREGVAELIRKNGSHALLGRGSTTYINT